jgi:hypothetical protein
MYIYLCDEGEMHLYMFIYIHIYTYMYMYMYTYIYIGRRKQGAYPWDESDYCQKWQVYLTLEEIRRGERRKTGKDLMWVEMCVCIYICI